MMFFLRRRFLALFALAACALPFAGCKQGAQPQTNYVVAPEYYQAPIHRIAVLTSGTSNEVNVTQQAIFKARLLDKIHASRPHVTLLSPDDVHAKLGEDAAAAEAFNTLVSNYQSSATVDTKSVGVLLDKLHVDAVFYIGVTNDDSLGEKSLVELQSGLFARARQGGDVRLLWGSDCTMHYIDADGSSMASSGHARLEAEQRILSTLPHAH